MTSIDFCSKGASYKLIEFKRLSIGQSSIKNLVPATENHCQSSLDCSKRISR